MKCLALTNHCFNLSDKKTKWIDPQVIELDNSESEEDFDFIPPSPTPEEILYFSQTRLVPSIHYVNDSLCLFEHKNHIMSRFENRCQSAGAQCQDSVVQQKPVSPTIHNPPEPQSKDKTSERSFSIKLEPHLEYMQICIIFAVCFFCLTDEQLLGLMESICALVDSIPEHEVIGLSCGNELLLKRAQRCVRLCAKK